VFVVVVTCGGGVGDVCNCVVLVFTVTGGDEAGEVLFVAC